MTEWERMIKWAGKEGYLIKEWEGVVVLATKEAQKKRKINEGTPFTVNNKKVNLFNGAIKDAGMK